MRLTLNFHFQMAAQGLVKSGLFFTCLIECSTKGKDRANWLIVDRQGDLMSKYFSGSS
ncbi:hypothetical protein [Shewanella sp. KCT]|uniref:hypothetical protein n=1 Tax=Shewanella sp. KCT TaxID=2569535 RepID=UPI0016429CB0|nr:hypothetical protein [Shewanella sp. KCT]